MSTAHDDVLKSALALPESDRIRLATELLDSLPGTPPGLSIEDSQFLKELERRADDPAPGIAWEEIQRTLEGKLRK
jgi:putative addiction module component (TIGR02574 family)